MGPSPASAAIYYKTQAQTFLAHLHVVSLERSKDSRIPEAAIFKLWSDIGRLVLLASEVLPEKEYFLFLSSINLSPHSGTLTAQDFRKHYLKTIR